MKHQYKFMTSMLVLCLVVGVSTPAFAQRGGDDVSGDTTTLTATNVGDQTPASDSGADVSDSGAAGVSSNHQSLNKPHANGGDSASNTEAEQDAGQWKGRGKAFLSELKQHPRSEAQRQKACQARQHGLETKLANLQKNSQNYDQKVTDVFTKVVAYHDTNKVTVSDWDQLMTAAQSAQATAKTSVDGLQGLSATLDCTNPDVAQTVATFKAGAQQTRSDLKAYKMAVINLITALEQAKGDKQ